MVIDSDIHDLQKLNSELSKNFAVLTCSRGTKALNLLQIFQPVALLLDPTIFRAGAKEFIHQVRSIPQGAIPIIALTKITTMKQIEDSFCSGVDLVYSKPCANDRIRLKLLEILSKPQFPKDSRELATAQI